MKKRSVVLILIIAAVVLLTGCATSSRKVTRTSADTQTDLSGRWNDTDSRLVAEKMVEDLMNRPWLSEFVDKTGSKPVVIVGTVRNRSSEHIDTNPFIKDIERELINSGKVTFVAGDKQREEIRKERQDQQTEAAEKTIKRLGEETGADFMMQGVITSQEDMVDGTKAVLYQVDLELINIETNEKVWMGSKKIKKVIEQRKYKA
jgi:penicillin-binding protein activator